MMRKSHDAHTKGFIAMAENIIAEIQERLFEMQDVEYQAFQCKLMPTVEPDSVIGVRMPQLRQFAKEIAKREDIGDFLEQLPHQYYEENNLHGLIVEAMKDYDLCIAQLDRFLPYVNNWATCDMMSPKIFKKHLSQLLQPIQRWMAAEDVYMVRFGIGMLMKFYLDDAFEPEYLEWVAAIQSDEYYINMMIAWYFATALAKQYDSTIPFLEKRQLSTWVHNKTIQKAVESYRIKEDQKTYLRTFRCG